MKNVTTTQLENMTTEELQELNSRVVRILKARRIKKNATVKAALKVGEAVKVNHPQLAHYPDLVLQKINKTRGVVVQKANYNNRFAMGGWTVPLHMISMK